MADNKKPPTKPDKLKRPPRIKSAAETELASLAAVPREDRNQQQQARYDQLQQQVRRERFTRIAPKRVQNVINAVAKVAATGARTSYSYTEEEAKKIMDAINKAVDECESAFRGKEKGKNVFAL